jgi:hypothetical protein
VVCGCPVTALEAAANTSQDFAMSLAAGLTLWGLMGVGRDD